MGQTRAYCPQCRTNVRCCVSSGWGGIVGSRHLVGSGGRLLTGRRVNHHVQVWYSRGFPVTHVLEICSGVPVRMDIGSYFAVHCVEDSLQLHRIAAASSPEAFFGNLFYFP